LVAPVQVFWTDTQGIESQRNGYSLDSSPGGLKMELPGPLPINSQITVRLNELNLIGTASVRHCRREGRRYLVGVSFRSSPSEVTEAEPPLPERVREESCDDSAAERRFLLDEPVTDDVRLFFQARKEGRLERAVAEKRRHEMWLRVAVVLWIAVGVLFTLNLPRLLRYASDAFPHPLLERASAFVETLVN